MRMTSIRPMIGAKYKTLSRTMIPSSSTYEPLHLPLEDPQSKVVLKPDNQVTPARVLIKLMWMRWHSNTGHSDISILACVLVEYRNLQLQFLCASNVNTLMLPMSSSKSQTLLKISVGFFIGHRDIFWRDLTREPKIIASQAAFRQATVSPLPARNLSTWL